MKGDNFGMCICLCLRVFYSQVSQLVGIQTETPAVALGGNEEVKPLVCTSTMGG